MSVPVHSISTGKLTTTWYANFFDICKSVQYRYSPLKFLSTNYQSGGYDCMIEVIEEVYQNDGGSGVDMIEMMEVVNVIVSIEIAALIILEESIIIIVFVMVVIAMQYQDCNWTNVQFE